MNLTSNKTGKLTQSCHHLRWKRSANREDDNLMQLQQLHSMLAIITNNAYNMIIAL